MGMPPADAPDAPRVGALVEVTAGGRVLRQVVVPTRGAPGDDRELTGARFDGDALLQCARSELLWVDPRTLQVQRRLSHPLCYDVHDALVRDGALVVSCTGHDSIVWLDADGRLLRHHWLREPSGSTANFATTYGPAVGEVNDWRDVPTARTKPHQHHPNQVFLRQGALWVTLFEDRLAREVDGPGVIELPEGAPHDGCERQGLHWFTTVTGHVIAVDPRTLQRVVHLDLNRLLGDERLLGWCRGVEVDGDTLYVGFTMLRVGRHRELLRRLVRGRSGEKLPSRVVAFDWRRGVVLGETVVGGPAGGAIYAINASRT